MTKQALKKIINNWISFDLNTDQMSNNSRKKLRELYFDDVKKLKSTFKAKFSMWIDFE